MADAGLAARVLRRCVADLVRKARVRASLGVGRSAALVAGRLGQAVWSGVLYTLYRVVEWPVVGPETRPVPSCVIGSYRIAVIGYRSRLSGLCCEIMCVYSHRTRRKLF